MKPTGVAGYEIEPKNKFFAAVYSITKRELHPGHTVTFLSEVDLTEVEQIRSQAGARGLRKPSYTAFVVKGIALALREFSFANRRVTHLPLFRPKIQKFHRIDAAVLVERELTEAPMVAFVDMIRDADQLSIEAITDQLRGLATADVATNDQWRSFKNVITRLPVWLAKFVIGLPVLFPKLWVQYRGGAFVVSSPAKYGVDTIVATWPWPLGFSFGLVKLRPVVRDKQIVARPTFTLTLNFDRRLMAGAQAARFFKRIVDMLEHARDEMVPAMPLSLTTEPVGADTREA